MTHKEFKKFDAIASGLLKVPHAEIKEKLETEKREKGRKKAKKAHHDDRD